MNSNQLGLIRSMDFIQLNTMEAMYMRPGDVAIVRTENVPELGDHLMIVTGPPIRKNHGIRPQSEEYTIISQPVLDELPPYNGVKLIKLTDTGKEKVFEYLSHSYSAIYE